MAGRDVEGSVETGDVHLNLGFIVPRGVGVEVEVVPEEVGGGHKLGKITTRGGDAIWLHYLGRFCCVCPLRYRFY